MKTQASKPLWTRTNGDNTKSRILILINAITLFAVLAIPPCLAAQDDRDCKHARFVTIDVPGAGTGNGEGTYALGSNAAGAVVGGYLDAGNDFHGSCALATVLSPHSTGQARAQVPATSRLRGALTLQAQSLEVTLTPKL
jgi:hypothetical protein